jgi:hypothetical protein
MKIFIEILIGVLLVSSCIGKVDMNLASNENRADGTDHSIQSSPGISSDTAVFIAKGRLFMDYDLKNREVKVEDAGNAWKVTLYRIKHQDFYGGDPVVWIDKSNGEFIRIEHAK